jgi:hypothetical protein
MALDRFVSIAMTAAADLFPHRQQDDDRDRHTEEPEKN